MRCSDCECIIFQGSFLATNFPLPSPDDLKGTKVQFQFELMAYLKLHTADVTIVYPKMLGWKE